MNLSARLVINALMSLFISMVSCMHICHADHQNNSDRIEMSLELDKHFMQRLFCEAALLFPFSWQQPSFWVQVLISCLMTVARYFVELDIKIKHLLWPTIIVMSIF